MEGIVLRDLTEGRNEWSNIPDIIRETFKQFSVLISDQQRTIAQLREVVTVLSTPKPQDDTRVVQLEREVLELQREAGRQRSTVETVQSRLATRVDGKDFADQINELKRSFEAKLKQKADIVALNTGLATRLATRTFEEQMETKMSIEQLEFHLTPRLADKADSKQIKMLELEIKNLREGKVSREDMVEAIGLGVADRVITSDFNTAIVDVKNMLDIKANAADVARALDRKADADEVRELHERKGNTEHIMNMLDQKADLQYVNQALISKADDRTVTMQLNKKADRDEVSSALDNKAEVEEINAVLTKHVTEINQVISTNRRETELLMSRKADLTQVNELLTKISRDFNSMTLHLDLKADRVEIVEMIEQKEHALNEAVRERSDDVKHHAQTIEQLKAHVDELSHQVASKTDSATLQRAIKSCRDDVARVTEEVRNMVASKASEEAVTRALGRKLEMVDVEKLLQRKANAADVALELDQKANLRDIEEFLTGKADTEALIEIRNLVTEFKLTMELKASRHEVGSLVDQKASREELGELRSSLARFEKNVTKSMQLGSSRADDATRDQVHSLGTALVDLQARIADLSAAVERKAELRETTAVLQEKASTAQVQSALEETVVRIRQEMDLKANLTEVQQLRRDNADLGAGLLAVTHDAHQLVEGGLDELRKAHLALGSKLAEKADAISMGEQLARKADKSDADNIAGLVARLDNEVKRKADRNEFMTYLDRKAELTTVEMEVRKLPTREEIVELNKNKVEYAEFKSTIERVASTRVSRDELAALLHTQPAQEGVVIDDFNSQVTMSRREEPMTERRNQPQTGGRYVSEDVRYQGELYSAAPGGVERANLTSATDVRRAPRVRVEERPLSETNPLSRPSRVIAPAIKNVAPSATTTATAAVPSAGMPSLGRGPVRLGAGVPPVSQAPIDPAPSGSALGAGLLGAGGRAQRQLMGLGRGEEASEFAHRQVSYGLGDGGDKENR